MATTDDDLKVARAALAIAGPALSRAQDALEQARSAIDVEPAAAAAYAQIAIGEVLNGLGNIAHSLLEDFVAEAEAEAAVAEAGQSQDAAQ